MHIKIDGLISLNDIRLNVSEKHTVASKLDKAVQTVSRERFEKSTGPVPKSAFEFFQGRDVSGVGSSSKAAAHETWYITQQVFGRTVSKEEKEK